MLMAWVKLNMATDLLPTVVQDVKPSQATKVTVVDWIRSTIVSASDTLGINQATSKEFEKPEEDIPDFTQVVIRERRATVEPASFPSYLNNGHTPNSGYKYRRASLLDGLEKTLDLTVSRRAILMPPLADTKRKLNQAFKNLIYRPDSRTRENVCESSSLPVPLRLTSLRNDATGKAILLPSSNSMPSPATQASRRSTAISVAGLVTIFVCACAVIGLIYNRFPELSEAERAKVKLPSDIEDAKELGRVLSKYKETYHYEVMSAFFITYIFLQTFAIPGSVFLSILSGFMYPFKVALPMVCLCSGIGASGCYMISYFVGKPLVHRYLEERVRKWNEVVDGQREHLFNYLLFLRITPFLPNWFINIVSPVIKIPLKTFFVATFFGVAPLSFIAIQAGTTLYQLTTAREAMSWTGLGVMAGLAVLSLVPVFIKNRLKEKYS